eukprot:jgi/Botrbrau1/15443/Bobra.43_2s0068.1
MLGAEDKGRRIRPSGTVTGRGRTRMCTAPSQIRPMVTLFCQGQLTPCVTPHWRSVPSSAFCINYFLLDICNRVNGRGALLRYRQPLVTCVMTT